MMWPFYLMALVAIVSTVRVVTNANPVHALLSLIVSLLAVAGMFMIVGAPFAGALGNHCLCGCDHGLVRIRGDDAQPWSANR